MEKGVSEKQIIKSRLEKNNSLANKSYKNKNSKNKTSKNVKNKSSKNVKNKTPKKNYFFNKSKKSFLKKEKHFFKRFEFFNEIKTYSHKHPFVKFAIIISIFLIYFTISLEKYGLKDGALTGILTWSFFVFCTPIADAGILVDFPARLLTGIRMLYSEIIVWIIAASVNTYAIIVHPEIYQNNILLRIFQQIVQQPFPYGIIIILSATGTFFSILFGDEVLDVISKKKNEHYHHKMHHNNHKILITAFILITIIILYYILIKNLGISF